MVHRAIEECLGGVFRSADFPILGYFPLAALGHDAANFHLLNILSGIFFRKLRQFIAMTMNLFRYLRRLPLLLTLTAAAILLGARAHAHDTWDNRTSLINGAPETAMWASPTTAAVSSW
jgi:hypothetical protein